MSPPHADDSVILESTYPALEKPDFKSQIPPHLLEGAGPQEQYLMSQLSVLTQLADWNVKAHLSQDRQLRFTNGKVRKHEGEIAVLKEDRRAVVTGWKLIAAVAAGIAGVVGFLITVYQALNGTAAH